MAITKQEIRLRIIEGLLPPMTRLGLNDPSLVTKVANQLENYVDKGYKSPEEEAASVKPPAKKPAPKAKSKEGNESNPIPGLNTSST